MPRNNNIWEIKSYKEYKQLSESEKEIFKEIHKRKGFLLYVIDNHIDKIDKHLNVFYEWDWTPAQTKETSKRIEEILSIDWRIEDILTSENWDIEPIKKELKFEDEILEAERVDEQLKTKIEIWNIANFAENNEYSSLYYSKEELKELWIKIEIEREVSEDIENEQKWYIVYKIILPKWHYSKNNKNHYWVTYYYNKNWKEILNALVAWRRYFTSIRKPN